MKITKLLFAGLFASLFMSCASGYNPINPASIAYKSNDIKEGVTLEYRYGQLEKKYAKKEKKKGLQVVAVKIKNDSDRDLMFDRDIKLVYGNNTSVPLVASDQIFSTLKQKGATYLFYLLLTPITLNIEDGRDVNSIPIGLGLGPGIAGANMITAGSANKKFENDLMEYDLNGVVIKKGETKVGLLGIANDSTDNLKLSIE